jgi:hypothetical protein
MLHDLRGLCPQPTPTGSFFITLLGLLRATRAPTSEIVMRSETLRIGLEAVEWTRRVIADAPLVINPAMICESTGCG